MNVQQLIAVLQKMNPGDIIACSLWTVEDVHLVNDLDEPTAYDDSLAEKALDWVQDNWEPEYGVNCALIHEGIDQTKEIL